MTQPKTNCSTDYSEGAGIIGPVTAAEYAAGGWPVLPTNPANKRPLGHLVPQGVNNATTHSETVKAWWGREPQANVSVACGAPGPQVFDIDDPDTVGSQELIGYLDELEVPYAITGRGRQYYFKGTEDGTRAWAHGELRGRGSYVQAPPSIHPSGRRYAWGRWTGWELPPLPDFILEQTRTSGGGPAPEFRAIEPGEMYEFLKDRAVRLVRAGIYHEDELLLILTALFDATRVPGVAYNGGCEDTERLARWAAESDIAARERVEDKSSSPLYTESGGGDGGVAVVSSPLSSPYKRRRQHGPVLPEPPRRRRQP